jgi:hypothetical protein
VRFKNNLWLCDLDWSVRDCDLKKTASKKSKKLENDDRQEENDVNIFENLLKTNQKSIEDDEEIELNDVTKKILAKGSLVPKNVPYLCGYPKWVLILNKIWH